MARSRNQLYSILRSAVGGCRVINRLIPADPRTFPHCLSENGHPRDSGQLHGRWRSRIASSKPKQDTPFRFDIMRNNGELFHGDLINDGRRATNSFARLSRRLRWNRIKTLYTPIMTSLNRADISPLPYTRARSIWTLGIGLSIHRGSPILSSRY